MTARYHRHMGMSDKDFEKVLRDLLAHLRGRDPEYSSTASAVDELLPRGEDQIAFELVVSAICVCGVVVDERLRAEVLRAFDEFDPEEFAEDREWFLEVQSPQDERVPAAS